MLLKDTSSFKKLIWLILFSMRFMFLEIGLVEKLNIIFLPKWVVVIPSLDICRGKSALVKGVPRITSSMRALDTMKLAITMDTTIGSSWLMRLIPLKSLSMKVIKGRLHGDGVST